MIDWITILLALSITAILVGVFGYAATKINVSDPLADGAHGKKDDSVSQSDSTVEKRKKDKTSSDSRKKKSKDKKKKKTSATDDQNQQRFVVKFVEPTEEDSSDGMGNEPEDSDQDSTPSTRSQQAEEVQLKSRKGGKNRRRPSPVAAARLSTERVEGILKNKSEHSPITLHPQLIPHPILETNFPKDEVELARQHHQQNHNNPKPKQTNASNSTAPKKASNVNSNGNQEQPFTTVAHGRHKTATPVGHPATQQNNKATVAPSATPVVSQASAPSSNSTQPKLSAQQKPANNNVQQEALPQRQPARIQQNPVQVNGVNGSASLTQATPSTVSKPQMKIVDYVKGLPTSQAVVTELMLALDAYPLSVEELNIVMHKIANKQAVINQDWSKLQQGQKVDPQAHIGQVLDESARAYGEDLKTNATKRIKELTDELNNQQLRINDLLKMKNENEVKIQLLHNQLESFQRQQSGNIQANGQQQHQALQMEIQRLKFENMDLNKRLNEQQQQQPLTSSNHINTNGPTQSQIEVMANEIKRSAIANSNLEKKVKANEELMKKFQEDKEKIQRSEQKLLKDIQDLQQQSKQNNDHLVQELNETRARLSSQKADYDRRVEQLERELEQSKRQEIFSQETVSNGIDEKALIEMRGTYERDIIQLNETIESLQQHLRDQEENKNQLTTQLTNENNQLKNNIDQIRLQADAKEIDLLKELENLKAENNAALNQQKELNQQEIERKSAEINNLRVELEQIQTLNETIRKECEQNQPQNESLYAELEQIKAKNATQQLELDQMKQQNEDLKTELDRLNPQFVTLEAELEQARSQTKILQSASDQMETKLQTVQVQFEQLITERDDIRTQLDQLKNQNEALLVELKQATSQTGNSDSELNQTKAQLETLQVQLEQSTTEKDDLRRQLDQIKPQIEETQAQLERATSQQENLRTELDQNKSLTDNLQLQIEQVKDQNENLRQELEHVKTQNDGETEQIEQRLHQEHDKYKQILLNLLPEDVRSSFVGENQDFGQWLSSYQETYRAKIQSDQESLQEECNSLKRENERLQSTMEDVESYVRGIEKTVQNQEELFEADINDKTNSLERAREENGLLKNEITRLTEEINRLRHDYDTSLTEVQTLKVSAGEGPVLLNSTLAANHNKMRSFLNSAPSKEVIAAQDSIVHQLLDKCVDDRSDGTIGEANHDQENITDANSNSQPTEQKQAS